MLTRIVRALLPSTVSVAADRIVPGFQPVLERLDERLVLTATPVPFGLEFVIAESGDPNGLGPIAFGLVQTAMDAAGNFVVCWDAESNGNRDVVAQCFDAAGNALSEPFIVNDYTTSMQVLGNVARAADGNFVITWNGSGQVGLGPEVFARLFDAQGNPLTGDLLVNTTTYGAQEFSSVSMNTSGNFVVTWAQGNNNDIFAQRFDASGTAVGAELKINSATGSATAFPQIALDGNGNFVVAWTSGSNSGTKSVLARRVDASNTLQAEITVKSAANNPVVAIDASGNFAVVYSLSTGIAAKRFSSAGVNQGGELFLPSDAKSGAKSVVYNANGEFTIVWSASNPDPYYTDHDIYIKTYGPYGTLPGFDYRLNLTTAETQSNPDIAVDGSGNMIAIWKDEDHSITARRLTAVPIAAGIHQVFGDVTLTTIEENASFTGTIKKLRTTFWDAMATSGVGSVLDIANWQLLRNGVDITSDIHGITYANDPSLIRWVAELDLGSGLLAGNYELRAKASLRDALGRAFDGDGDAVAGDDFVRRFTIANPVIEDEPHQVNTFITGHQRDPAVAVAGNGDYVVVWTSVDQDGAEDGIYGQRFDATGAALGGEFLVNTTTTDDQHKPCVAMNAAGDFVVVWVSGYDRDIMAQRFDASGVKVGGELRVDTLAGGAGSNATLDVAMASDGSFIVTWEEVLVPNRSDVVARRFDAAGVPLGNPFQVNTSTTDNQTHVQVAIDADGSFVIVWEDRNGYDHIRGQRYDSAGNAVGAEIQISHSSVRHHQPDVAFLSGGQFIVVWDKEHGILARRFDATGNPLGNEIIVKENSAQSISRASVVVAPDGGVFIAWRGTQGIHSQAYDPAGNPLSLESLLFEDSGESQIFAISMDGNSNGQLIVAWERDDGSVNGFEIFAQRFLLNVEPTVAVTPPLMGLRTGGQAGHAVRGQRASYLFQATDPSAVDESELFTYRIDWNGDGVVDETVVGTSTMAVDHVFSNSGTYQLKVTATDQFGGTSEISEASVIVVDWDFRTNPSDPSKTDLHWGGTTGIDAYGFVPGGYVFKQAENNQFFGTPQVVHAGSFNGKLYVYAQGGNDLLFADVMNLPVVFFGGDGDDVLVGGRSSDYLDGGAGNDILLGGTSSLDGDDTIFGGAGSDFIVGQAGADLLDGGTGQDLVMAGTLFFIDSLPSAVYSIQAEWLSGRPLADRVANLSGTGSGSRNNGDFFLAPGVTALDDGAVDQVLGGDDQDWLLADLQVDLLPDLAVDEIATDLG